MQSAVYSILSSLLVAIVASVVTVRLSLGQFRSERWWERKADAYSRIIGALSTAVRFFEGEAAEFTGEGKASPEVAQRWANAWHDLQDATGVGAYIVSDETARILADLSKRRNQSSPGDLYGIFSEAASAYESALAKIRQEAKRDLQVKR